MRNNLLCMCEVANGTAFEIEHFKQTYIYIYIYIYMKCFCSSMFNTLDVVIPVCIANSSPKKSVSSLAALRNTYLHLFTFFFYLSHLGNFISYPFS